MRPELLDKLLAFELEVIAKTGERLTVSASRLAMALEQLYGDGRPRSALVQSIQWYRAAWAGLNDDCRKRYPDSLDFMDEVLPAEVTKLLDDFDAIVNRCDEEVQGDEESDI